MYLSSTATTTPPTFIAHQKPHPTQPNLNALFETFPLHLIQSQPYWLLHPLQPMASFTKSSSTTNLLTPSLYSIVAYPNTTSHTPLFPVVHLFSSHLIYLCKFIIVEVVQKWLCCIFENWSNETKRWWTKGEKMRVQKWYKGEKNGSC